MASAEQLGFWAAIRDQPDEDTPRLVYADWLQENGDEPRAEFIRVQCELAKLSRDRRKHRKERAALEPREQELLAAHRPRWIEPFRQVLAGVNAFGDQDASGAWLDRVPFRRGLLPIHSLELEGMRRLASADDLEPPDEVTVSGIPRDVDCAPVLAAFARWSGADCLGGLSLCGRFCTLADEAVAAFVSRPRYPRLWYLGFYSAAVTDAGSRLIAGWPGAASITHLNLHDCPITDAGVFALADSPHLRALTDYQLYGTQITDAGYARFRERPGAAGW